MTSVPKMVPANQALEEGAQNRDTIMFSEDLLNKSCGIHNMHIVFGYQTYPFVHPTMTISQVCWLPSAVMKPKAFLTPGQGRHEEARIFIRKCILSAYNLIAGA